MQTFLAIVQLIPALIQLIKAVEEALPKAGLGTEKLALVRQIFETTYDSGTKLWPLVEPVIGAFVAIFNKAGIFSKTSP